MRMSPLERCSRDADPFCCFLKCIPEMIPSNFQFQILNLSIQCLYFAAMVSRYNLFLNGGSHFSRGDDFGYRKTKKRNPGIRHVPFLSSDQWYMFISQLSETWMLTCRYPTRDVGRILETDIFRHGNVRKLTFISTFRWHQWPRLQITRPWSRIQSARVGRRAGLQSISLQRRPQHLSANAFQSASALSGPTRIGRISDSAHLRV